MPTQRFASGLVFMMSVGLSGLIFAQETKVQAPKVASTTPKAKLPAKADEPKVKTQKATFGGGCFWCLEAVYESVPGVKSAVSGYAGGLVKNPTYAMVSTGETGHAEVVQVEFDPEVVTYERLLDIFFHLHDPTTLNAQGPDFGTQYRSIILYHTDEQKAAAQKAYEKLTADGAYAAPIVTQLEPLKAFYPADKHHQDYYRKNKRAAYCQTYIVPKLKKLNIELKK